MLLEDAGARLGEDAGDEAGGGVLRGGASDLLDDDVGDEVSVGDEPGAGDELTVGVGVAGDVVRVGGGVLVCARDGPGVE